MLSALVYALHIIGLAATRNPAPWLGCRQSRGSSSRRSLAWRRRPEGKVALGGESLTFRMFLGGALVRIAMYTVELIGRRADATAEQDPCAEMLHHEL